MPCLPKEPVHFLPDAGMASGIIVRKESCTMAKCAKCGKTTTFGHNRSFSLRATNRDFKPNLQKVTILQNGRKLKQVMCTKCIKSLSKSAV
jgi:large subunit ribosomal protein L28